MSATLNTNGQIILAALNITGQKPKAPVRRRPQASDYADREAHAAAVAAAAQEYATALASYDQDIAAYDQQVKANARDIKVMLGDRSRIVEQLDALDKALDPDNDGGKVFPGTIVSVAKEESSKRAIVTVFTGTDREAKGKDGTVLPAGHEQVRTDRTDNPDGRAIARAAQLLIGHRVLLYVELEAMRSGTGKARVARHFEDLGVDDRFKDGAVKA